MTNTDSIQTQLAALQTPSTTQRDPTSGMGKDDFLKLLVQELKYQDPLDPMKGTDYVAQLAQFSGVEQLSNISSQLTQSSMENEMLTTAINNAMSANYIGKEVRASGNAFQYDGSGSTNLGFTLAGAAETTTVKIYDSAGSLVRTLSASGNSGDNTIAWDGKDDAGTTSVSGKYTFEIDAQDGSGNAITAQQFISGTITGVRFKSTGTVFVIDGMEVALSNILEIGKE
jgi:flagellar basal-body rod modification protein FlgD